MLRRELRRAQLEPFFRKLAPTDIVLEACGGSHHWGRMLTGLGHRVRLLPAPDALITPPGSALQKVFTLPATGRLTVNVHREFPALAEAAAVVAYANVRDVMNSEFRQKFRKVLPEEETKGQE